MTCVVALPTPGAAPKEAWHECGTRWQPGARAPIRLSICRFGGRHATRPSSTEERPVSAANSRHDPAHFTKARGRGSRKDAAAQPRASEHETGAKREKRTNSMNAILGLFDGGGECTPRPPSLLRFAFNWHDTGHQLRSSSPWLSSEPTRLYRTHLPGSTCSGRRTASGGSFWCVRVCVCVCMCACAI
jgi:hypothetical protein